MSTMLKTAKRTRSTKKGQITRIITFLDDNPATERIMLDIKLTSLETLNGEFNEAQSQIEELIEDESVYETELVTRYEIDELYHTLKNRLMTLIQNLEPTPTTTNSNSSSNVASLESSAPMHSQIRLERLKITKFKGEIENFAEFLDMFESLVNSIQSVAPVEKFSHLKQLLEGEPLELIRGLPLTNANYKYALELLKERYSNPKLLIYAHMGHIHRASPIQTPTAASLKKLIDEVVSNARALENLGLTAQDLWELNLVHLITSKLDDETRTLWERDTPEKDPPTLNQLKAFLGKQITVIDVISKRDTNNLKRLTTTTRSHAAVANSPAIEGGTQSTLSCPLCSQQHPLYRCPEFRQLDCYQRLAKVRALNICANCLRIGHIAKKCTLTTRCKTCSQAHHTMLHLSQRQSEPTFTAPAVTDARTFNSTLNQPTATAAAVSCEVPASSSRALFATTEKSIVLPVCFAKAYNSSGESRSVCVMLDSCSDSDYVAARVRDDLKLPTVDKKFAITGIGGTATVANRYVSLRIRSIYSNYELTIEAPVLDEVSSTLPPIRLSPNQLRWLHDQKIDFDPRRCCRPIQVDVLLGAEHFFNLIQEERRLIPNSCLSLIKSQLGWFVSGTQHCAINRSLRCHIAVNLEKFWRVEEVPDQSQAVSIEEEFAEQHFRANTIRLANGQFQVRLPFVKPTDELGDTRAIARSRLVAMERKMSRNPQLRTSYNEFMQEYLRLGHMALVNVGLRDDGYYLPHHAVLKPNSTTTKLRVVFDGSASPPMGESLNKILAVGRHTQLDLFVVLIRFRQFFVALVADIEKMYRMIQVHPRDRKFQRIMWRFKPEDPIATYELSTITYGTSSASYSAVRCVQEVATQCKDPVIEKEIKESFYVDDYVSGANSIQAARYLRCNLSQELGNAGFHLRKWISNFPEALEGVPASDLGMPIENTVKFSSHNGTFTLGISWDVNKDCFVFNHPPIPENRCITKRSILSNFSKFFDPLGLCAPIITQSKVFLQKLWALKVDWDEEIHDPTVVRTYNNISSELRSVEELCVPRLALTPDADTFEIHGFCDASEAAFAAVVYARSVKNGVACTHLLCCKTKVAPLKSISIPRLELCAAFLLNRLVSVVSKHLCVKIERIILWSDSSVVLNWLQKIPRQLSTFVANRIAELQRHDHHWRHITSECNPADIPTRFITAVELKNNSLWWHGPNFLCQTDEAWPPTLIEFIPNLPEIKSTALQALPAVASTNAASDELRSVMERFSSYHRLLHSFTYVFRFAYNLKVPDSARLRGPLTPNEVRSAKICLIKAIQKHEYANTLDKLRNNQQITKDDPLFRLTPSLDPDQVIRIRGRLANAPLPFDARHPIILPTRHHFSKLLIMHTHWKYAHAGPQLTLNLIRQEFWLTGNPRTYIRKLTHQCTTCLRYLAGPLPPLMGQLPEDRTTATYPFETTGIDYAGPFTVRINPTVNTMKVYIAVFICFTVKAVHLEIVDDLTTASFIAALRRFTSRRGLPRRMISDNATTFIGASTDLQELYNFLNAHAAEIDSALTAEGIQWEFIPPNAPHMGGLWEAAVKSMKAHLRRVIGRIIFTYNELFSLLTQVEACLNSRPLTALPTDPIDTLPLTPAHFLIGRNLFVIPDDNAHATIPVYRRWRRVQAVFQQFWDKWHIDYLNTLQQRTKWFENGFTCRIGDVMLIREDNAPPSHWAKGVITDTHPGADGIIRVVDLRTTNGTIRRPVVKLIPLVSTTNLD